MSGEIKVHFDDGCVMSADIWYSGRPTDAAEWTANLRHAGPRPEETCVVVVDGSEAIFVRITPNVVVQWDADDEVKPENQHEEHFLARVKAAVAEGGE